VPSKAPDVRPPEDETVLRQTAEHEERRRANEWSTRLLADLEKRGAAAVAHDIVQAVLNAWRAGRVVMLDLRSRESQAAPDDTAAAGRFERYGRMVEVLDEAIREAEAFLEKPERTHAVNLIGLLDGDLWGVEDVRPTYNPTQAAKLRMVTESWADGECPPAAPKAGRGRPRVDGSGADKIEKLLSAAPLGRVFELKEIAAKTGLTYERVKSTMPRLVKRGDAVSRGDGRYSSPSREVA